MGQITDPESQGAKTRRTAKDSVFSDLFRIPRYTLELVNSLHPGLNATEKDIETVSLHSVMLARPYNDLGLLVKDRLIILVETQSTWSVNILIRILIYLAATWNEYIVKHKLYVYGSKKLPMPMPEFYVVYTGKRRNCPEELSLAEEFFPGSDSIDLRVRVLTTPDTKNIIGQYIRFCHVLDQQIQKHGPTRLAVEETIRICRNENVLKDYLEQRRQEVTTIMMTLFSQKEVIDAYGEECREEGENKLARLMSLLLKNGKTKELQEVLLDKTMRDKLYLQYNIR